MDYQFKEDLISIREILELTQMELAHDLSVEQATISRSETGETRASSQLLERAYSYAFSKGIRLGRLKEMLWTEGLDQGHKLLFHGAKGAIQGALSADRSRENNDFGKGFYTGESYGQAISFISAFDKSCVYMLDFDSDGLKPMHYEVATDWMLTIAYYRGALSEYADDLIVKELVARSEDCDYIIAPIADNRMFQIIDSFVNGEITEEQCRHCLAATNLGNQYVFRTERALRQVRLLERCYIAQNEREYYRRMRSDESRLGEDKVKLARRQYRGKGRYIDEIFA